MYEEKRHQEPEEVKETQMTEKEKPANKPILRKKVLPLNKNKISKPKTVVKLDAPKIAAKVSEKLETCSNHSMTVSEHHSVAPVPLSDDQLQACLD